MMPDKRWQACIIFPMTTSSSKQERIGRYKRKLSKVQSETILKTTKRKTEINVQAANRFITAAIPELSADQKQALKQVCPQTG